MKNLIAYTLLFIAALATSIASAEITGDMEKRLTEKGYPYGLLVERVDSVKILFSEDQQGISCSVELENKGSLHKSDTVYVKKNRFEQKPLSSCLARSQAKTWLAQTF
ncbi:hypothetical protein [Aliiglaciecola sp. M165]|uniref:hypothetical protein n=1 Tax=Aliiglaciecola sp. M165 TaxID=2593649 RepID=UPI00117D5FE0|nr:hypothetical protein [Aliiglaciecola sp. M165]TRY32634.1 hypothetical protein FM019_07295 [Aliiglaciecola sp. M165]